ncbi:hypothetical protein [Glycomyces harbinensis]|uniref:Uncharacterized protein n=1 Tax=Glycomyces harbinensis TaxID=58114 RepID=A0A1G6Y633_9ACTN|nr:hypothetical protein [Glycomyces harbinensis]SDD85869.1 hypothetical protein SAMN05216270_108158 [Glycomyces harbinensis]
MNYYLLEPEVAGDFGDDTEMDYSVQPPAVTRLQYRFLGWLGDEILESTPAFIVTEHLAGLIEEAGLTGYRFAEVDTILDEQAEELDEGPVELPDFRWLQLTGKPQVDDFGASDNGSLIASERALEVLRRGALNHCDIEPV